MNKTTSEDDATQVLEVVQSPIRIRQIQLRILSAEDSEHSVIVNKDVFTVGKDPACDLELTDPAVSRQHFQIINAQERHFIRDLESTNGTSVDGIRVKEAFLSPGSAIRAGNIEMVFEPIYSAPPIRNEELHVFGSLIAASSSMRAIVAMLQKVATSGSTVLLQGETGTGKSALAKAVHEESPRAKLPFVVFDCASVPPSLIESELFGSEKGAFTGAYSSRAGACERAHGGTLFVDEIEELPLELQTKLLRVLDERKIRRLGGTKSVQLDFQIIAASKQDLGVAVQDGKFRKDLYYRIAVVSIIVPPLRNRQNDIPILCDYFMGLGKQTMRFSALAPSVQQQLLNYAWPGNLRELRNVLERLECLGEKNAFSNMPGKTIYKQNSLSFDVRKPFKEAKEALIDKFEREYLETLLVSSNGKIAPAARAAGLNRKYFYDLLDKHGLRKDK